MKCIKLTGEVKWSLERLGRVLRVRFRCCMQWTIGKHWDYHDHPLHRSAQHVHTMHNYARKLVVLWTH